MKRKKNKSGKWKRKQKEGIREERKEEEGMKKNNGKGKETIRKVKNQRKKSGDEKEKAS